MRGLIFTGTPTSPKKSTPQRKPGSVHAKENQAPPTPSSLFGSPSSSSRQQQQQPAESPLPASGSQAGQGSSSFREDQSKPKTPEVFAGSSLTSPRTAAGPPAAAATPHHATTPSPRKTPVSMKSPFAQSDKPQFHSPVRQDSISNNSSTKETPAETIAEVTGDLVSYNIFKLLHKLKT